jgi:predicted kinase
MAVFTGKGPARLGERETEMLRACVRGDNPLVVVGLSEGNLMRLRDDQPIKASLASFGVNLPGDLLIFYGESEVEMERRLRKSGIISERSVEGASDPRVAAEASVRETYPHILICAVGLPRSGKTTWARSQSYPIVNPDSIRLAIHGQRFVGRAEPFVWAVAKAMVRSLFLAGHQIVILDATGNTKARRDEWVSPDWATFYRVVDTPADVCVERARAERDEEIIPIIERMAKAAEPLHESERVWP